ncbi:DMT family transporter [Vibrio marisflavi]|uniref:EamA domain-containing protein n=1 Tax=Vibrio marisflavi CECT 7928 TaxID=634439 RepID=A0ABM9A161_9VIBR|nr:DMT family transporter [Vibrio marisflavi]CAH0536706.1 hypothetical protein VMF7928_00639 [Vibrio marisflavi CECT 7928]
MNNNKLMLMLFFSVCLIWGTTWLAMEIAVTSIPPIFATGLRFFIASPILICLSKVFKQPLMFPKGKQKWMFIIAIFYFAIPFTLMIAGEKYISSGLASVIFANMPIAVMITSMLFLGLRLSFHQYVGILMSVISLYVILSHELGISGDNLLLGAGALVLAVVIHAVMYVFVQKHCKDIKVITYNALPCYIASMLLFVTAFFTENIHFASFTLPSVLAVVYLGVVASVGGIVAYFKLGQVSTPFTASICFLIFPLIALLLSDVVTHKMMSHQSMLMLIPLLTGILLTKLPFDKIAQRLRTSTES